METKAKLTESDLAQFIGTCYYYKHPLSGMVFTDGVKFIAEKAQAFWLIDAIGSYRRKEPFQIWELSRIGDNAAKLTMREDTNLPEIIGQIIDFTTIWEYTDLAKITIWSDGEVMYIPNEY